jgi:hypothetical protein
MVDAVSFAVVAEYLITVVFNDTWSSVFEGGVGALSFGGGVGEVGGAPKDTGFPNSHDKGGDDLPPSENVGVIGLLPNADAGREDVEGRGDVLSFTK